MLLCYGTLCIESAQRLHPPSANHMELVICFVGKGIIQKIVLIERSYSSDARIYVIVSCTSLWET